jgi:CHAT domain-containing protein
MKLSRKAWIFGGVTTVGIVSLTASIAIRIVTSPSPGSPEAYLAAADEMAVNNNWMGAAPLYRTAEARFRARKDSARALYAEVSQVPATMESRPLPDLIADVKQLLRQPGANQPYTHLRILTVEGMLEREYDAAQAKTTWAEVETQANRLGEHRLAARASGEQGILAFLLGDVAEASRRVKRAYLVAKVLMDRPAEVRYASLIGRGLVEFGRYQESLKYLNGAIDTAAAHPEVAKPMIAYEAKTSALVGLKNYRDALVLTNHLIELSRARKLHENLAEALEAKGSVLEAMGDWTGAIQCYTEAVGLSQSVKHWHSLNDTNAALAKAYERLGRFDEAMQAIDAAINANRQTPDEIYYVPRNLAIKAEIASKAGRRRQAEALYQNGADILEVLLQHVPTPAVERELMSELSDLYSGYFELLASDDRLPEAFAVIERAHGRLEAESLWYDKLKPAQAESQQERVVNSLELQLLDATDQKERSALLSRIYDAEQKLPSYSPGPFRRPVSLRSLQQEMSPSEIVLEYVLTNPNSSVLAITATDVHRYVLPSGKTIEDECKRYAHEVGKKATDIQLAQSLYRHLVPSAPEVNGAQTIIVVPDGVLDVFPFAALAGPDGKYLVAEKTVVDVPSATVMNLLRTREQVRNGIPYLGVAAWTQTVDTRPWVVREVTGPERSQLVPLPESKREIETAAHMLPQPDTLLLGSTATRTKFLSLPLEKYDVLHLSLHGYADMEFPDRSALVFAPAPELNDSGFLQAREIRQLHLNARLVTLSACKTAAGPIYGSGAATIVNAFIEAGAQSVVSTLWDVDDRSGRKLMDSFYRHLADGEGRAEALRDAKLEFVNAGQPPYYWANFQMVGDAIEPLYPHGKLTTNANGHLNRKHD